MKYIDGNFGFEKVDISGLCDQDINEIRLAMQDIWSSEDALGELTKCLKCGKIESKESLFIKYKNLTTDMRVFQILENIGKTEKDFTCTQDGCDGKLVFPYGEIYNKHLKQHFRSRANNILVLSRDIKDSNNIVGFEGGYSGSFEEIFIEFYDHYRDFSEDQFNDSLKNILGYIPDNFFICAYIGLVSSIRKSPRTSMKILAILMHEFARHIPTDIIAITEADKRNFIHRIFMKYGARSLNMDGTEYGKMCLKGKTHELYQSDILIHESPIDCYNNVIQNLSRAVQIKLPNVTLLSPVFANGFIGNK